MPNLPLIPGVLANPLCWPVSPQDFLNEIMAISVAVGPTTLGVVGPQDAEPDVEDRGKVWIRTVGNAPANPLAWIFFNGAWVAKHPMPAGSPFILIYEGTVGSIDTLDGGMAGPVSTTSGPFWEEVVTMQGRMPVGVGVLQPSTDPLVLGQTGGVDEHALTIAEMPAHVHRITAHGTNDPSNGNGVIGGGNDAIGPFTYDETAISTSNHLSIEKLGGDAAHPNMPPFRAVYFLRRTARVFLSQPMA